MAQVEVNLVTLLKTLSAVTAIVGSGDDARIRPDQLAEDDTFPALIIENENEEPQNDLEGEGGLTRADIVIAAIDTTKASARSLADAVKRNGTDPGTGLAGYTGTVSGTVLNIYHESTSIDFVPLADGSDEGWFEAEMRFTVWHDEVV